LYLAQRNIKGKIHYFIRESFKDGDGFKSRDLFPLNTNPARYIIYPGGNAYYIDSVVEETLSSLGVEPSGDDIEDMFWPFLKPDTRRALESFRFPETRHPAGSGVVSGKGKGQENKSGGQPRGRAAHPDARQ